MKKLPLLILLLLLANLSVGQTSTLQLSAFDKLEIFGPFKVRLIKSETAYAEVDFNGMDKEDIVFEVQRETLKMKLKSRALTSKRNWTDGRNSKYIVVNLYYKDIDLIEAAAGAIVKSNEQLKSKYLVIDCSMGAQVSLDVYAKKIDAISTMGGELKMRGETEHLEVKANMGGILDARDLESKTVYVRANMGAEVIVNSKEEIEASAGFGASVDYLGGASVRHTSRNFGGEVNRRSDR